MFSSTRLPGLIFFWHMGHTLTNVQRFYISQRNFKRVKMVLITRLVKHWQMGHGTKMYWHPFKKILKTTWTRLLFMNLINTTLFSPSKCLIVDFVNPQFVNPISTHCGSSGKLEFPNRKGLYAKNKHIPMNNHALADYKWREINGNRPNKQGFKTKKKTKQK